jgi:ribosome-associated toxin RatA of RatAB toxin-antitoxin module
MDSSRIIEGIEIDSYTKAPLQLHKSLFVTATPDEVFTTLANHTAMPEWFPGMTAVRVNCDPAQEEGGVGTVRYCAFGEEEMTEDIVLSQAPTLLAYAIRDGNFMGLQNHFALVTVKAQDEGSLVSWYQFFNHPYPDVFNEQGGGMLEGALNNLRHRFESVMV